MKISDIELNFNKTKLFIYYTADDRKILENY